MLHTLENLTMTDLCTQVGEWSRRNFGEKQASDLGIVEELGEFTHGILKRYQGIRGFEDPVKFTAHIEDALADMGIYLLNLAGTNDLLIAHSEMESLPLGFNDRKCMVQLLMNLSVLLDFVDIYGPLLSPDATDAKEVLRSHIQRIWDWVTTWAKFYDFDLRVIVTKTWIKVRARDWQKNRDHAHLVAEGGGVEVPASVPASSLNPPPGVGSIPPEPGAVSLSSIPVPGDSNHYKAADQY